MELRGNWIDGARCPARGGRRFAARREETPLWPRSAAEDVGIALDSLAAGAPRWRALGPDGRGAVLERLREEMEADPDADGAIAAALGLASGEGARLPRRDSRGGGAAVEERRPGAISIVRTKGIELLDGLGSTVLAELARPAPVLVVADPTLPEVADRLATAACGAGVPPDALAVLFDDGSSALRAAIASGRAGRVVTSGTVRERDEVERRCAVATGRGAGFGAGIVTPLAPPESCFRVLRSRERVVSGDEDPERAACTVARQSFGRIETLWGQHPSRIGIVRVAARVFSAFTNVLLRELEGRDEEPAEPPPFLELDLEEHLVAARDLGLDEGATLVHEAWGDGSLSRTGGARMLRLIFTNVEPRMRLASELRPAPLLLLMRVHP